jgi:hypothetical protein
VTTGHPGRAVHSRGRRIGGGRTVPPAEGGWRWAQVLDGRRRRTSERCHDCVLHKPDPADPIQPTRSSQPDPANRDLVYRTEIRYGDGPARLYSLRVNISSPRTVGRFWPGPTRHRGIRVS